jgi:alpha-L-fucosidase
MNRENRFASSLWSTLMMATWIFAAETEPSWLKPDPAALQRWQTMRFGMFIHWGPVSLTGHEIGWSRGVQTTVEKYDNLYKDFNPTRFNADEWVGVAKAAGMRYIVLTTKHHDGFCLWNTRFTDYNIMHTPFGRDVVKELSEACKKQGIAFGTYYSVTDWYHPDWPTTSPGGKVKREKSDLDAYEKYLQNQIKELITGYGPLITIWNDMPEEFGRRGLHTIEFVRTLQHDVLINNRTGAGGDYDTPEQRIGGFNVTRPWETCMTICRQWSWKPDDTMKTLKQCLEVLIRTAGGDGNLLFNVGPMPSGEIEPRQVERLKEMGAWLQKYGESIYGTRGGPYTPDAYVASTRRGNMVYIHILDWPREGDLHLPAPPARIKSAKLMNGGTVETQPDGDDLVIKIAQEHRQAIDTLVRLEFDRPALDLPTIKLSSPEPPAGQKPGPKENASH